MGRGSLRAAKEFCLIDDLGMPLVDDKVRVGGQGTFGEVVVAGLHVRTGEVGASDSIVIDGPGVVTAILFRFERSLVGEGEVLELRVVRHKDVTALIGDLAIGESILSGGGRGCNCNGSCRLG